MTSDCVVLRAKRLDSEDVEETIVGVDVPSTESAQRNQLTELVHARYPGAEFRSFANDAASFLAPKVLVVAVYHRSTPIPANTTRRADITQQQLFAA